MMDHAESLFDSMFAATGGGAASPASARPYDPPTIAPDLLTLNNRLGLRRPPVAVALGDATIGFSPIGLGSIDSETAPWERVGFGLRIDGRPLMLRMAKSLYERILARIDPELLVADIDDEILPLLLESCIEDGLSAAEAALQARVELVSVQKGAAFDLDGLEVALQIFVDSEKAGLAWLCAAKEDVQRLAHLFAARPTSPRSYGDLKVDLRFRAGAIWLDLGALRSLKTGDVLLVEEDASRWERMAATAGERWLFPIEITRTGPTVRAAFRRADARDQEEWMMADHDQADGDEEALNDLLKKADRQRAGDAQEQTDQSADQDAASAPAEDRQVGEDLVDPSPAPPPADAAFDDLPIKLVFELGRLEMPLGELQEIGPGHVFQLDRPLGEAVEIHAGGRRIGQGEIMRIEDQVGVRVIRLFGQGGA